MDCHRFGGIMSETLFRRRATAEEHYGRGLELKRKGYLLEAEEEFRRSLEADPAFFDPLLEIFMDQEQASVAEDIRSDQLLRRADQRYKLGMALLDHGQPQRAVRHLRAACDLEGDNARYFCALAEALAVTGRPEEAAEKLRVAADLKGGSDPEKHRARAHYLLARMHLKAGHVNRAKRRLLLAYALDPQNEQIAADLKKVRVGVLRRMILASRLKRSQPHLPRNFQTRR